MRNVQLIQGLPFNLQPIQDITDTLPTRKNDPEPYRNTCDITHIAVHHSGVEGGTIKGYADYHVNTLKWYHIGYHMVIVGNQISQTNDLQTFSYHTSSNNNYTIGISVSGDFTKRALSDGERYALYGAILTVMDIFKIPVENVLGHDEYPNQNTLCPAFDMKRVRSDIRTIQNQMLYAKTPQHAQERAFKIANQILYFYNLAQGKNPDGSAATPGNVEWGKNVLLDLDPFMTERGLL